MELVQDSFSYLDDAHHLVPNVMRPSGYSLFLRAMSSTRSLAAVATVQHLMGLAMAVLVYMVLRRLGARSWMAALGAAPILLDGTQIYVEQFILAETLFEMLAVSAVVLLLWCDQPRPRLAAVAGILLGAATVTRTVGLVLLVPAVLYFAVRRLGWRPFVSFVAAAGLVLCGYTTWFHSHHGTFALERYNGYFLAGRVEPFARCKGLQLPITEMHLCDDRPVEERLNTDWYIWNPDAPLRDPDLPPPSVDRNANANDFALRIIRDQPVAYATTIVHDLLHYFSFGRTSGRKDNPAAATEFATHLTAQRPWRPELPPEDPYVWAWTWPGSPPVVNGVLIANHGYALRQVTPSFNAPVGRALNRYQRWLGTTPGPLLAIALLVAVAGMLKRGQGPPVPGGRPRLRWSAGLLGSCAVLLLLGPAAGATFDYRYLLPALAFLPAGGVVGALLLVGDRGDAPSG